LAIGVLFCVSTGRDSLNRRVFQGNVLLLDNELHDETIQNRTAAATEVNHVPLTVIMSSGHSDVTPNRPVVVSSDVISSNPCIGPRGRGLWLGEVPR